MRRMIGRRRWPSRCLRCPPSRARTERQPPGPGLRRRDRDVRGVEHRRDVRRQHRRAALEPRANRRRRRADERRHVADARDAARLRAGGSPAQGLLRRGRRPDSRLLGQRVRPYAEATAGFARLRTSFSGIGCGRTRSVNAGLQFLDSTRPMLGVGTGVMIQGGPVVVDSGYRFNKISAGNAVQSALAGGDFGVHQFRFGLGFRF